MAQVLTTAGGKIISTTSGDQPAMIRVPAVPVPAVTDVQVNGAPVVGMEYTAGYTYSDPAGREEDHTGIVWYHADDTEGTNKAQLATGTSYTLQSSDAGKFVYVSFIPYASDGSGGTVAGNTVETTPFLVRETYYENPYQGRGWNHMLINVVNISFNGGEAGAGDEIAVFDGDICCAHYTLTGAVTIDDNTSYISIPASKVDMGDDGYTEGNTIIVRYWRRSSVEQDYSASLEFFDTNGTPVTAPVFTVNETAFVKVTINP